jgi:ankyrin repeat protein
MITPKKINSTSPKLRRTGSLITLLLLAAAFNAYSMEQPVSEEPTLHNYVNYIGDVLLNNVQFKSNEYSPLEKLPLEIKSRIASLLLMNTTTDTLKTCAKTISTLAQINRELNESINNPQFCLKLIKHLAKKFNCSDETVTMALQTHESHNRLKIQKLLEKLLCKKSFNEKTINSFYKKYKNYVDLNFTYQTYGDSDFKNTPLFCAAKTINNNSAAKIKWLLNSHAVDVNCANKFGLTPLMECAINAQPATVALLCKYPSININQKNNNGETALMLVCKYSGTPKFNLNNMNVLINAGADLEIANNKGETPLQVVEMYENQKAIDLIKGAITKKHKRESL